MGNSPLRPRGLGGPRGRLGTGLNRPLGSRGLGGRPSLPGNRGLGGRTRPGMSSVRPGGNPLGFSGLRKPRRAGSGGARRMRTPGVGNVLTGRNRNRRGY